jgi:hypothetical protein
MVIGGCVTVNWKRTMRVPVERRRDFDRLLPRSRFA